MLSKSPGAKQVLSNKKAMSVAAIQVLGLASCLCLWMCPEKRWRLWRGWLEQQKKTRHRRVSAFILDSLS